jgi:hypothetical protein
VAGGRDVVAEYAANIGRLSQAGRLALLRTFDRLVPARPTRPASSVTASSRASRPAHLVARPNGVSDAPTLRAGGWHVVFGDSDSDR